MKKIFTIALLFLPAILNAQTVTTTSVSLGGVINCQSISLAVTKIQNTETKINYWLQILQCSPGSTRPDNVVAYYSSPITETDFTTDKNGAHLNTSSPYGPVKIDWTITKDSHTSFDGTWTQYVPNQGRQTQNDDVVSAHAIGNIGNYVVDKNGYFSTSVVKR